MEITTQDIREMAEVSHEKLQGGWGFNPPTDKWTIKIGVNEWDFFDKPAFEAKINNPVWILAEALRWMASATKDLCPELKAAVREWGIKNNCSKALLARLDVTLYIPMENKWGLKISSKETSHEHYPSRHKTPEHVLDAWEKVKPHKGGYEPIEGGLLVPQAKEKAINKAVEMWEQGESGEVVVDFWQTRQKHDYTGCGGRGEPHASYIEEKGWVKVQVNI